MLKRRNKFWTIVFSLFPGAGHMFMGFMRQGLSLMALFLAVFALASWINLGPLMLFTPIFWFYSFFDCLNKCCASDEEFSTLKDDYIFEGWFSKAGMFTGSKLRYKKLFGIIAIVIGAYLILNNFLYFILGINAIPLIIRDAVRSVFYMIPQLLVAALIIYLGVRMILGKKEESRHD